MTPNFLYYIKFLYYIATETMMREDIYNKIGADAIDERDNSARAGALAPEPGVDKSQLRSLRILWNP